MNDNKFNMAVDVAMFFIGFGLAVVAVIYDSIPLSILGVGLMWFAK